MYCQTLIIGFTLGLGSNRLFNMRAQQKLFSRFSKDMNPGLLTWIGVRPARFEPLNILASVRAIEGKGLEGDHRCGKTPGSSRQVTVISREFISQIEVFLKREIPPGLLRRNLVVEGLNLNALRHQQFQIGSAVFEATALCHPCNRMEKTLGKGAVVAMLGHGGLCAKVIQTGCIALNDSITVLSPDEYR